MTVEAYGSACKQNARSTPCPVPVLPWGHIHATRFSVALCFHKKQLFDCVDTANLGSADLKYFQIFPIYTRIEGCAKPDRRNQLYSIIKAAMSGIGLSLTGSESKHGT